MVFCGQCGYQLAPGYTVCPRCGAQTEAETIEYDPGAYNPTEISHAILDAPTQGVPPHNRGSQPRQPEQQGPLVLGSMTPNERLANEATTSMNSQTYPPQQAYPGYPQQAGTGMYGYNVGGYQQQYQAGQSAVVAQLLEASRKGKITALLLILFGLLLLIVAIIIFLLTRQGIIFSA